MYASVARMPTTEHILLESDFREVPDLQDARTVHARLEFRSRLRRRVLQLEIIDYYYLSVRSHSHSILLEYVLDLRFVDAPRRDRKSTRLNSSHSQSSYAVFCLKKKK